MSRTTTDQQPAPSTTDELVAAATERRDVALLAAAARAGLPLPPSTARLLSTLEPDGVETRVAGVDKQAFIAPTAAASPVVDSDHPPPLLTTPRIRKALLALLAATDLGDGHPPYPGTVARLHDVIALTRPATATSRRHILGALRALDHLGYCVLDEESEPATVRPGPRLAGWNDRFVRDDLPELLSQVRGDREAGP